MLSLSIEHRLNDEPMSDAYCPQGSIKAYVHIFVEGTHVKDIS